MDSKETQKVKIETKSDKFWGFFLPIKDGKVKSTLIINSFSLSLLFVAVYVLAYLVLIDPIDAVFSEHMSPQAVSIIESIVPALMGSAICCSFSFLFTDKRLVPFTYSWLFLYGLIVLVCMLRMLQGEELPIFLSLYAMVIVSPLMIGSVLCAFLYKHHKKKLLNL